MRSVLWLLTFGGCATIVDDNTPQNAGSTRAELTEFVKRSEYKSWRSEAASHPSLGPHDRVRVYENDLLLGSLEKAASSHPAGSMAVKELYDDAGAVVIGHAVMKKRADGTWVWFEGYAPDYEDFYFAGSDNLCGNCHRDGVDFALTPASAFR